MIKKRERKMSDISSIIWPIQVTVGCCCCFLLVVAVFKLLRPKFAVKVECWCCGLRTSVKYEFRNCWECPECDQYNGFNQDGGYNKTISAQYDERLNPSSRCVQGVFNGGQNKFCDSCTHNQLVKVKQLAKFTPFNEKNYDYEVEMFRQSMEKMYELCPDCDVKVYQELEHQNETLSRYFDRLDDSQRMFLQRDYSNTSPHTKQTISPFLHSSFLERTVSQRIIISVLLHGLAAVCSNLLALKHISADANASWQRRLVILHPFLLWLDRHSLTLVVIGLSSAVLAKLLLGKYRLRFTDVVSVPVWLFVLLSEAGYIQVAHAGFPLKHTGLLVNWLLSFICVTTTRRGRSKHMGDMARFIKKQQDLSGASDTASSVSPFSSVSQRTSSHYTRKHSNNNNTTRVSRPRHSSTQHGHDDGHVNTGKAESRSDSQKTSAAAADTGSVCPQTLDEISTELNSCSFGESPPRRTNSGIFFTASSSCSHTSTGNRHRNGGNRPLISPASFQHISPASSHHDFSANSNSGQFSRSSFVRVQPTSQHKAAFSSSPFPNVPLHSDSQFASTPLRRSTSFPNVPQQMMNSSFSSMPRQAINTPSSFHVWSDRSSYCATPANLSDISEFSSVTNRCAADSSSDQKQQSRQGKVALLWHPGFIGFVFGASIMANIMLGFSWLQHN